MHICELVRLMPSHSVGGMQTHADLLSRTLVEQGHRVTLLTAELPGKDEEEIAGVRIVYVRGTRPTRHTGAGWQALNQAWDRLHARDPFDIVHAHSSAAEGWVHRRRPTAPPLVVTMHGTHWSAYLSAKRALSGKPKAQVKAALYLLWTYLGVATRYLPRTQANIFVNPRDFTLGRYLYPGRRCRALIPNGIDTVAFSPEIAPAPLRKELELQAGVPIIMGVGRIVPEKGFRTAIEALSRWAGTIPYLILIGDGPDVPPLQQLAQGLGLSERVRFVASISHALLPSYLNAADLFVSPSWAEESGPLVLLEAMACARPVVASKVGGVSSIIASSGAAELVALKDSAGLHAAIARLLADPVYASQLGARARQQVTMRFSISRMAADTGSLFEEVVKSTYSMHER